MKITEIAALKVGDKFKYHGEQAIVTFVRPKYPDEKTWIVDKNSKDKGNWVMIPDKSIAIGFEAGGQKVGLVSTKDSKQIVDGVFQVSDFSEFGYTR